jgi:hypothetical protein
MSLVIGVDPGGTTGLAAVEYTPERGYRLVTHLGVPFTPPEVVGHIATWQVTLEPLAHTDVWWIAAERFVVSRRAGRSSVAAAGERARAILGALEAAFPSRVKLRNAGTMKPWNAGDRRLEAAGLVPTQGRPHTRDAAGHALYFHVVNLGNPDPLSMDFELEQMRRAHRG